MSSSHTLSLAVLADALRTVIDPADSVVIVHCGLWSFGHAMDVPLRTLPDRIVEELFQVIGPRATLVMPTFCLDFPRTRKYDRRRTRPQTGVVPQAMLARDGVSRTARPIYNYAVAGPRTSEVLALRQATAWGPDSFMQYAYDTNARFVSIGVPWRSTCAYYHLAEERLRVPYRYHKRFYGALLEDGAPIGNCEEVFYVRGMHVSPDWDYDNIFAELNRRAQVRRSPVADLELSSGCLREVVDTLCELIARDPYYLVANREAVRAWVANGKDAEVAALPEPNRPGSSAFA